MKQTADDYTTDELICACIARQIEDGEAVAQGIATPLVAAGYILAKLTHAPSITFTSAIGNAVCSHWRLLSLSHIEETWLGRALRLLSFAEISCELLPTLQPKEFFRPAQIDAYGNFNNVVIGDYYQPHLRLPGCGGIADVTNFSRRIYLYVPRHERRVFVEKLDFRSGVGHLAGESQEERRERGITSPGPRYLVSDLGQFDFANGRLRLVSYHPGVTAEEVQAKTGFPLEIAPDLAETSPPTEEEVRLLREEIDPLGVRKLECLTSQARRLALWEIIEREKTVTSRGGSHAAGSRAWEPALLRIKTRRFHHDNAEVKFGRPGNHELG
ncbi:MAG: ketoacid-CoA transferase [Anaerolineae bacterium]|nr:ketoacid-CoA transferase [Anaerolineae bacterium]